MKTTRPQVIEEAHAPEDVKTRYRLPSGNQLHVTYSGRFIFCDAGGTPSAEGVPLQDMHSLPGLIRQVSDEHHIPVYRPARGGRRTAEVQEIPQEDAVTEFLDEGGAR